MNSWVDLGESPFKIDGVQDPPTEFRHGYGNLFWFDEHAGRLFLRARVWQPMFNAVCISYRYGSQEPVPAGIKRLCNLIVATNILTMDFYSVKVGMGGDISGLRDQAMSRWAEEQQRLYSAYQRSGSVHSMLR